jgi:hypothetical protein
MHKMPDWKITRVSRDELDAPPDSGLELRKAFDEVAKVAYTDAYDLTSYEPTNSGTPLKINEDMFRKALVNATPLSIKRLKSRTRAASKPST